MRAFNIYRVIDKEISYENLIFVDNKFSFLSFFFLFFYTVYKKCYLLSFTIVLVLFFIGCLYYCNIIVPLIYFFMQLTLRIYAGFSYHEWYQESLKKTGYILHDVIYANNVIDAKLRFFKQDNNFNK